MFGRRMMMMTPMDMFETDMQETYDCMMMANCMDSCMSSSGTWMSKEEAMKRCLNRIHTYENWLSRCIKEYECQMECFNSKKTQLESVKKDMMNQIEKCHEEMKKQESGNASSNPSVLKKVFCRTPEMEMEEQYDSMDPSKCYRILRKSGESPQMVSGPEYMKMGSMMMNPMMRKPMMGSMMMNPMMGSMMGNMMGSMMGNMMGPMSMGNMMEPMSMGNMMNPMMMMGPMISNKGEIMEPMGGELDEKFYKLCCMCGCCTKELKDMFMQHKDCTIGQLYDKACEMKMCGENKMMFGENMMMSGENKMMSGEKKMMSGENKMMSGEKKMM